MPLALFLKTKGFDPAALNEIAISSVTLPVSHVTVHERLARAHVDARIQAVRKGEALDWATVEAMAFGSLLTQGYLPWFQRELT